MCDDIVKRKRQNNGAYQKIKYPISIHGRGKPINLPINYSAHAGDVEQVQPYASVDARKCLEQGVAGERYKPIYSVDRALDCML